MTNAGAHHESKIAIPSTRHLLAASALVVATAMAAPRATRGGTVLFGEADPAGLALAAQGRTVHPLTAAYYNEESLVTTDPRAWYVDHQFPGMSPIGGGDASVYALQIRAASTGDIQFVAYEDGYVDCASGAVDDTGWNDIAAGFEWTFLQDWQRDLRARPDGAPRPETGVGEQGVVERADRALQVRLAHAQGARERRRDRRRVERANQALGRRGLVLGGRAHLNREGEMPHGPRRDRRPSVTCRGASGRLPAGPAGAWSGTPTCLCRWSPMPRQRSIPSSGRKRTRVPCGARAGTLSKELP